MRRNDREVGWEKEREGRAARERRSWMSSSEHYQKWAGGKPEKGKDGIEESDKR